MTQKRPFVVNALLLFPQYFTLVVLIKAFMFDKPVNDEMIFESIGFSVLMSIIFTFLHRGVHET